jgi:hypothetical protein
LLFNKFFSFSFSFGEKVFFQLLMDVKHENTKPLDFIGFSFYFIFFGKVSFYFHGERKKLKKSFSYFLWQLVLCLDGNFEKKTNVKTFL